MTDYLDSLRAQTTEIRWAALPKRPRIEQPSQVEGLQAADSVAGCVYAAVRPDRHGDQESCYLEAIAPRLWTGPTQELRIYGLQLVGKPGCEDQFPWLPRVEEIAKQATTLQKGPGRQLPP